jgi:acetylornithine deacetylase/succinyl-diaminopimelate desuccinylase-like protein
MATSPVDPVAGAADEAVEHLGALLRMDTTNPPGNESICAEYLAESLRKDGIEPTLVAKAKGRANVVARIKGNGEAPPLLLGAHLDVVEADAKRWRHPPFSGAIADGYLWGRGALDMKNMAAMSLMVVKLLRRSGARLRRDVIFAGVADEEVGCDFGSRFLVEEHPELVRAEYALGEVGGFTLHVQGRRFYPIMVAEKGLCWLRVRARGTPGHGSLPREDNANVRLARAVARLGSRRLPQHTTPFVKEFVQKVGATLPMPQRLILERILDPRTAPAVLKILPDRSLARSFAAVLSNTVSPTVLRGGNKTNVIPSEATCELDGRILPGQTEGSFLAELRAAVGRDVEFEILKSAPPTVTSAKTPLFETLCRTLLRHDPEALPVPYLMPGFTDAKSWSRLGTKCYGFVPLRLAAGVRFADLFHGDDERVPVDGVRWGVRVLYEAVRDFCS